MKILLIFILLLFPAIPYSQNDAQAKMRVDSAVAAIERKIEKSRRSFTVKKRDFTEQWNYSVSGEGIEFFDITYWYNNTKYLETYYLQNDKLLRAAEREDNYSSNTENSEWLTAWSGDYYFENRKLVFLSTNGHGKSEMDEWQPEKETLDSFGSRLKELKRQIKFPRRKTGK